MELAPSKRDQNIDKGIYRQNSQGNLPKLGNDRFLLKYESLEYQNWQMHFPQSNSHEDQHKSTEVTSTAKTPFGQCA
jgi:hypothetical protein